MKKKTSNMKKLKWLPYVKIKNVFQKQPPFIFFKIGKSSWLFILWWSRKSHAFLHPIPLKVLLLYTNHRKQKKWHFPRHFLFYPPFEGGKIPFTPKNVTLVKKKYIMSGYFGSLILLPNLGLTISDEK